MPHLYIARNLAQPAYQAVLSRWICDTPERFAHAFDELAHFARSQPGPRCLVHGDAHQGNSFLRSGGQRVWYDWQLVRQGQPWRDVNYFMLGALTVQERRASAEPLLRHNLEALLATGAQAVPDFDTAWQHFRRWPVYGMQAWLGNVDSKGGLANGRALFCRRRRL